MNNGVSAYEEARNRRIEENRKRMQDLNLPALSHGILQALNGNTASNASSKRQRIAKPQEITVPARRSSRLANLRAAVYCEITPEIGINMPERRSSRIANLPPADYREISPEIPRLDGEGSAKAEVAESDASTYRYASDVARLKAEEAAAKIAKDLGAEHPSFLKSVRQSHVCDRHWLGLPTEFCSIHMPKTNEWFILEGQNGKESNTLFCSGSGYLSAGWRDFWIFHGLEDGDCLVFQLVEPRRFKVFIVRAAAFEPGAPNSEELLVKRERENLDGESFDKELSAKEKEISDQKKRKTSLTEEAETSKAEKGKAVNVVVKSETMVESHETKWEVKIEDQN